MWQNLLLLEMFLSILYSCFWKLNFKSWDNKNNKEDSEWEWRLHRQDKKALNNEKKEEDKQEELTFIKKYWQD